MSSASGEQGGAAAGTAQEQNDGELRAVRGGASGRSASPAKRSAADMEEELDGGIRDQAGDGGGGGGGDGDGGGEVKTGFDDFVEQLRAEPGEDAPDEMDTSSAEPPASSAETERPEKANLWNYSTEQIDEQVRKVTSLLAQPLDVGQKGAIVSCKWLSRVMSRSSEGLKSAKYPKEAREGSIGQVDNSDIVPDRAFDEPHLHDIEGRAFIPLRPGLVIDEDYQVFSHAAWGEVMASYGLMPRQFAIERYVRNTAPTGSTIENLQYENYPPTFTIRKVASRSPAIDESRQKASSALENLRQSKERKKRGQMSPDDAVQLVSSRQEKFQQFLKRSKEAAEIPLNHKVRIWRVLNPSNVAVDKPNIQPLTPQSREASPKAESKNRLELIVDKQSFKSMARGVDIDHINVQDQTHNSNYNGNSDMEIHALTEDTTLIFEEVTTGPGGGEFASNYDANKTTKAGVMKRIESKPVSAATSGRTSPAPAGSIVTRGRQRRDGRTRGTIGLSNLGNTCYMNSALQCIRSVEELAVYFLSDLFKKEINTDNPLGHNGAMAKQYAVVLQGIYGDQVSGTFTPSAFKRTLGQSQPLFSGYGQQDSQEFLSFLVDALHEDLNRIHKKPYIENPDSDDNTVHDPNAIIELGETFRSNHAKRNDSVAMDLFNGFYKNTMECPECEKISITFDPYSLVTLQLPVESNFQHTVTFVPLRGKPVNHMIDMDKNSTLLAMKQTIASKHPGVSADRLWMIEVYSHKPFKQLDHSATLADASIQANDYIFVYELESRPSNAPTPAKKKLSMMFSSYSSRSDDEAPEMEDRRADRFAVPIMSRQKGRFGNNFEMLLHPMYITVTRDEAQDYEVILKKVLIAMAQLTSRPILTEFLPKDVAMTDAPAAAAGETDENGQVSDRSVPSEDGYVEVSLEKESQESNGTTVAEAPKTDDDDDDDRAPPANFMDANFQLPDELRNQLFKLKYAPSDRGMYCAGGMQSYKENGVRDMAERVKKPSRRSSVQSRSSDDSSTSTNSSSNSGGAPINGEVDDSATEIDDFETPDIVIGDQDNEQESYLAMPTPTANEDSDDDLSVTINQENTRQGRRKNNKKMHRGKNRRNQNAHSRKGWNARNKQNTFQSSYSAGSRANPMDDDNPYYIKLGEGIIVDWFPEAFQQLFAGRANDANDERGHFLSHPDGKNLPYVIDPTVDEKKRRREERRKHGMTLEDCFAETGKRERLSEDNAWYCNRCKKLQQATKTLEIWTIPDILVVHLKRFGGNRSARDKIDTLVDYPISGLDMTKKVGKKEDGKEYLYDLFAVDNHFGGLGGGHYTAMAKNFYDGKWYDYNDSVCSKLGDRAIHSAAAYLLFYRRRSEAPLGPEYLQNLVLDFRNSQPGANNNPDGEDSDAAAAAAGEDQLGGPTSSPHQPRGSSSVSATTAAATATAGAGATARNARGFPGAGGAGAGTIAGSNLTTKGMGMGTTAGMQSFSIEGPDQLSGQQSLLNAPSAEARSRLGSWNFDTLDDADEDGGPNGKSSNDNGTGINGYGSARLLLLRDRDADAGNDEVDETAVSDAAEADSDDDRRGDDDDDGDVTDFEGFQSGRVSPAVGDGDEDVGHWDDHALYSSAHDHGHDPQEGSVHSLHLHDAGNMGGDEADEGEEEEEDDAHEIRLPKKSDHDDEGEENDDLLT